MTVDLDSRRRLSGAIKSYLNDEIDNLQFDDAICGIVTNDGLCMAVIRACDRFYGESVRELFSKDVAVAELSRPFFVRWSRLLETGVDFDAPELRTNLQLYHSDNKGIAAKLFAFFFGVTKDLIDENQFWPLKSEADWNSLGIPFRSD